MAEGDEEAERTQENILNRIFRKTRKVKGFFGRKGRWALTVPPASDGRGKSEDWGGHGKGLRKSEKQEVRGGNPALRVALKIAAKGGSVVEEDEGAE